MRGLAELVIGVEGIAKAESAKRWSREASSDNGSSMGTGAEMCEMSRSRSEPTGEPERSLSLSGRGRLRSPILPVSSLSSGSTAVEVAIAMVS